MDSFGGKNFRYALLCYAALLLYATLWPFDFHFVSGFAAARKISWIPFFDPIEGPNRRDAVMNIFVFLPLGALSFLANCTSAKIRRPVLIATLFGGGLSLFVEVAQIWLPTRHPSISDLLMNATGALLGALLARFLQKKLRSDPEGLRLFIRRNTVGIAVIIYAMALLVSTMRTFDPLFSWKILRVRATAFAASPLFPDHLDLDYTAWMTVSFGFLSFLAAEWWTGSSTIRRRPFRYACAFVTCSIYAIALEGTQILFRSRHPLLGHALLGTLGVAYGIGWHAAARFRKMILIPLFSVHYIGLVFLAFLAPLPHSLTGFRFDYRGLIPLYFYLQDISMPMLYEAIKSIVLYIPMGIVARWTPTPIPNRNRFIMVIFSVGIQTIVEILKGISGYRSPDPSDIFLAALGSYAGGVISGFNLSILERKISTQK